MEKSLSSFPKGPGETQRDSGTEHSQQTDGKMATSSETSGFSPLIKYVSLVALTLQNAVLVLVMRYVRTRTGDLFVSSTAVVMSELFKFISCMFIILVQEGSVVKFGKHLHENIIQQPLDCAKIAVPSVVFVMQNNLLYVAVSNLEAATFQVTYQLKILFTALFAVVMLGKKLSKLQWLSLVLLFVGVSVVQLQPYDNKPSRKVLREQNSLVGVVAVLVSCIMSGFAAIYFEKILKGTKQSLWLRNVQLAFLGVIFGYITMRLHDGKKVSQQGFYFGYDAVVWFVVCLQSLGGLMVAAVIKYADNILKGFATSAAIILSCVASIYFFDFNLSIPFSVGASLVMLSVYTYSRFAPVASPAQDSNKRPGTV